MDKYKFISIIFILIFITGCLPTTPSPAIATNPPSEKTPEIQHTSTPQPKATASPTHTNTPTVIPATMTPTSTKTVNSPGDMETHCLDILDSLPTDSEYRGTVVLQGWGGDADYLMNLADGKRTKLPKISEDIVSPNHRYNAYVDWTNEYPDYKIMVTDANGNQLAAIPWKEDWFELAQWLDDQRLVIINEDYPVYSTVVLNPFTGEQKELASNYPNIQTTFQISQWGKYNFNETVYDPSLTRVLYMEEVPGDNAFVLWDIPNEKVLGRYTNDIYDYGQKPKWSPNGDRLAIIIDENDGSRLSADDIHLINRDGEISRLTFFSDNHAYSRIDEYSWSPDGRYITLWWTNDSGAKDGLQLIIVDTQTGKATNYCMPNFASKYGSATVPVWSPYGMQLLFDIMSPYNAKRDVILADLDKGFAAKIGEGRTPFGWMVETQDIP